MPTSTLRPDGTVSSVGTTVTGAASEHAALLDASDASYVEQAAGSGWRGSVTETLGTFSLPAGAVTKTLTGRVRASGAGATVALSTVYIPMGSFATSGSIVDYTTGAVGVTLSQANIDALYFKIETTDAGAKQYAAYLDVAYALIPTTAVTAPTGAVTTTSTPTCTWTHTAGTDGGAQTRYWVKVFSAAQYGAGGFDPETSTPTQDLGEQLGSAVSAVLGSLPDAGTWRAYVKTAQTINGAAHWAAWAYSGFTTSYTLPLITSVTLTPSVTLARTAILVTRTVMAPTWIAADVERSDDGGTTWVAVRGGTAIAASGTSFTIYDYEQPFATTCVWRARASSELFTGPYVSSTTSSIAPTTAWLKDVDNPANNMAIRLREYAAPEHQILQGVHDILGEPYPTVVSDVRQNARGTTILQTRTAGELTALTVLLYRPTLLLQTPPTWDQPNRYLALGRWSENHLIHKVRAHRHWNVTWTEIPRPPG